MSNETNDPGDPTGTGAQGGETAAPLPWWRTAGPAGESTGATPADPPAASDPLASDPPDLATLASTPAAAAHDDRTGTPFDGEGAGAAGGSGGQSPTAPFTWPPAGSPSAGSTPTPASPWGPRMSSGWQAPTAPTAPAGPGHWYGGGPQPPWGGGFGWAPPGGGHGSQPAPSQPAGSGKGRRAAVLGAAAFLTIGAIGAGIGIGYSVWSPPTKAASASHSSRLPTTFTRTATQTFTQTATQTFTTTRSSFTTQTTGPASKNSNAPGGPSNIATIATKVDPTIVDINTILGDSTSEAAGTGTVLTATGKILTNNHVIEGATSISATDLGNGETYQASVIGYDRTQDVAVIQLKGASNLKTANYGTSSSVATGDAVVGIGNAGGAGGVPSTAGGRVAALNQQITASDSGSGTTEHLTGLIETNCDIQPGDSGGPLVDSSGKIVGMDTAASEAQGFSFRGATGQGYSIPIDTALSIVKQIENGKSSSDIHLGQTPFLGVEVSPVKSGSQRTGFGHLGFGGRTTTETPGTFGTFTTTATATFTTTGTSATASGVHVTGVVSGTPAEKAGLGKGDVITSVGGTPVTSPDDLSKVIEQYKPGTTVKVTWTDSSGHSQAATVTFANGPAG